MTKVHKEAVNTYGLIKGTSQDQNKIEKKLIISLSKETSLLNLNHNM